MSPELPRPIAFLSDFGYADEFVAVCHAVIRTVDHRIDVIDISHGIEAGDLVGEQVTGGERQDRCRVSFPAPFAQQDLVELAADDPRARCAARRARCAAGQECHR